MPTITYIQANGQRTRIEVASGTTLMQAAVDNQIPSILAECGGGCSCATCHCFIEDGRCDELPPPDCIEESLLGMLSNVRPNSRLSCQVTVTESMEGLLVHLPEEQQL
ncbi:2Fe-2S iron-sulfur cluster-binding protein [Spongiibacter marinus]|uniref:2Fe-2S iron-sulfur cluster-binding protein n=1 Tax=Spongiibacter marinus TaxID=354246 RepID=UPI0035BE2939